MVRLYTDARVYRVGCSILFISSAGGHLSCVEALIRKKADVLQCDKCVVLSDDGWLRLFLFVLLRLGLVFAFEGTLLWAQGRGRVVFGCALMRARAGTVYLLYWRHRLEVTFHVLNLSSLPRLTCCNATSELFG